MIDACKALRFAEIAATATWPGKSPSRECRRSAGDTWHAPRRGSRAHAELHGQAAAHEGAEGEFDGSLIAALNEVMALFTPARWAYPDILLPSTFEGHTVAMPMHLDDGDKSTRAEVHLNTAELKLFTVGLFTLCVGCVKKPLNLLIWTIHCRRWTSSPRRRWRAGSPRSSGCGRILAVVKKS